MVIVRIEHPVIDCDQWNHAFESDPVGREQSGVRRYQVLRAMDGSNYVMIDLEFDTEEEAKTLLAAMENVWVRVQDTVLQNPRARIVEMVARKAY